MGICNALGQILRVAWLTNGMISFVRPWCMLNLNPGPPILPWEEGNGERVGLAGPCPRNDLDERLLARGRGTIWCASGRALDVGKHHLEHCWERQESGRVALVCGRIQFHFLSFLFFLVCVGDQVEDHLQGSGHLYVWALDCLSLASTPRCSFAR